MREPLAAGLLVNLNALAGGLFLLTTFVLVSHRQVSECLRGFVLQAVLLAASASILSSLEHAPELLVVAGFDLGIKAILIPVIFRRVLHDEVVTRREIGQTLNIPITLLLALLLTVAAFLLVHPLVASGDASPIQVNLPIGMAGLFVGGLTAAVRREAVPLFLGLLAMENSALFAGVGVAPTMPLFAEVAIAFDVLILVFVVNVLTRAVREHVGTTDVGVLTGLREGERR